MEDPVLDETQVAAVVPTPEGSIDQILPFDASTDLGRPASRRFPRGAILAVRGWAITSPEYIDGISVYLQVDDGMHVEARVGLEREDVALHFNNPALKNAGFRSLLSTEHLDAGPHVVRAFAVSPNEPPMLIAEREITIENSFEREVRSAISSEDRTPIVVDLLFVDGVVSTAPLQVNATSTIGIRGWAVDLPAFGTGKAVFAFAGNATVRGVYGFPRDDVVENQHDERFRYCGFAIDFPATLLPHGKASIRVRLLGADASTCYDRDEDIEVFGSSTSDSEDAGDVVLASTLGEIDEAVVAGTSGIDERNRLPLRIARGERLYVRGWAIDRLPPAPARAVYLLIDDCLSIRSEYGTPRHDVAEALKNEVLIPCGFEGVVPTDDLTTGHHTVKIQVLGADASQYYKTDQVLNFEIF